MTDLGNNWRKQLTTTRLLVRSHHSRQGLKPLRLQLRGQLQGWQRGEAQGGERRRHCVRRGPRLGRRLQAHRGRGHGVLRAHHRLSRCIHIQEISP